MSRSVFNGDGRRQPHRATVKSDVGLARLSSPRNSSSLSIAHLKREWVAHINEAAPPGIDARQQDNLGDAWRHYASAATLVSLISLIGPTLLNGMPIPLSLIEKILAMTETGPDNTPEQHEMDKSNNRTGADVAGNAFKKGYLTQKALDFMLDVGRGRVKVIDPRTGQTRSTTAADLPHVMVSDTDRSYTHPDRVDGRDEDTMIA